MNGAVRQQVCAIMSEVLNVEIAAEQNPIRNETENWDSLNHMELVLRLEEHFRIRFSIREVTGIHSLEDIVTLIEVKQ